MLNILTPDRAVRLKQSGVIFVIFHVKVLLFLNSLYVKWVKYSQYTQGFDYRKVFHYSYTIRPFTVASLTILTFIYLQSICVTENLYSPLQMVHHFGSIRHRHSLVAFQGVYFNICVCWGKLFFSKLSLFSKAFFQEI